MQRYYGRRDLIVYALAMLFFVAGGGIARATEGVQVVDRIVAVVNEDIITLAELNLAIKPYVERIEGSGTSLEQKKTMLAKLRMDMLNKMIDKKLSEQEVRRTGLTVSDKEVDTTIDKIRANNFASDDEMVAALASEGVSLEQYREETREKILRSKLVNREVKSKIVITSEDIQACYDDNSADYCGEIKYHLRHIILKAPVGSDEESQATVRAQMDAIRMQLKQGAEFEALARTHSQSPLADQGGDLGLFSLDTLTVQLQEAIKGLKAGEFTGVLDTEQGLQIFFVQEIIETPGIALEEVSDEIQAKLYDQIVSEKFDAWLESLRQRSHIKIID